MSSKLEIVANVSDIISDVAITGIVSFGVILGGFLLISFPLALFITVPAALHILGIAATSLLSAILICCVVTGVSSLIYDAANEACKRKKLLNPDSNKENTQQKTLADSVSNKGNNIKKETLVESVSNKGNNIKKETLVESVSNKGNNIKKETLVESVSNKGNNIKKETFADSVSTKENNINKETLVESVSNKGNNINKETFAKLVSNQGNANYGFEMLEMLEMLKISENKYSPVVRTK